MVAGRKPKPTAHKELHGNPGRRPLNDDEPIVPDAGIPAAPEHLDLGARVEWDRISTSLYYCGILSKIDRSALGAYCMAYSRWERAEKALATMAKQDTQTGALLVKTSNGNFIQNPLVGIANKAAADMMRYAAEFGMTPSSRTRLKVKESDPDEDEASEFLN